MKNRLSIKLCQNNLLWKTSDETNQHDYITSWLKNFVKKFRISNQTDLTWKNFKFRLTPEDDVFNISEIS